MIKQRQAICISPKELRKLADDREKELKQTFKEINITRTKKQIEEQSCVFIIINESECSDTWRFEL